MAAIAKLIRAARDEAMENLVLSRGGKGKVRDAFQEERRWNELANAAEQELVSLARRE
jgi:hypothetical protein